MTTTETYRYRGYDIVPLWQWSSWCTGVYPTRADLPILPHSTLSTLASRKEDAVTEAKKNIDRFLSPYGNGWERVGLNMRCAFRRIGELFPLACSGSRSR